MTMFTINNQRYPNTHINQIPKPTFSLLGLFMGASSAGCLQLKQYWIDIMIDRVLNFGPVQQQSYYFQLIPLSLSIVNANSQLPTTGTTYKFIVSKGMQKFDENKIPIQANFQVVNKTPVLVINTCRLNFYLPSYNKNRKHEFSLMMIQRENNEDYELGEYKINLDELITEFKENNKGRHEFKNNFSDDYDLEFQIYIEKNRMALERNIRENKTERINKSPLRARKDQKGESAKREINTPKQQTLTPSRDREEPVREPTPSEPSQNQQEEKAENKTEIYEEKTENRSPTPPPIEEERPPSPKKVVEIKTSPKRQERISFTQTASPAKERSEKNQTQSKKSNKSNDHIPVISVKQKPLSKLDTPTEIKLTESQRLGTSTSQKPSDSPDKPQNNELKQKVLLWLFLILSGAVMYYSMHPNKKV